MPYPISHLRHRFPPLPVDLSGDTTLEADAVAGPDSQRHKSYTNCLLDMEVAIDAEGTQNKEGRQTSSDSINSP